LTLIIFRSGAVWSIAQDERSLFGQTSKWNREVSFCTIAKDRNSGFPCPTFDDPGSCRSPPSPALFMDCVTTQKSWCFIRLAAAITCSLPARTFRGKTSTLNRTQRGRLGFAEWDATMLGSCSRAVDLVNVSLGKVAFGNENVSTLVSISHQSFIRGIACRVSLGLRKDPGLGSRDPIFCWAGRTCKGCRASAAKMSGTHLKRLFFMRSEFVDRSCSWNPQEVRKGTT
jgi:hypothetical protein